MLDRIYIVTHRYDLLNLIPCLESIKYWYPDAEVTLIRNFNNGKFRFKFLEKHYRLSYTEVADFNFGTYYGSLLPYLLHKDETFLQLDSDTVLMSKIPSDIDWKNFDFYVDLEKQETKNVKRLYFDTKRINGIIADFPLHYFTFNNGVVFGKSNQLIRNDFSSFMKIESFSVPEFKDSSIFPMYDMSAINVVLNLLSNNGRVKVCRQKLMFYPPEQSTVEHKLLEQIRKREVGDFFVLHWADSKNYKQRPYNTIYKFFLNRSSLYSNGLVSIYLRILLFWLFIEAKVLTYYRIGQRN